MHRRYDHFIYAIYRQAVAATAIGIVLSILPACGLRADEANLIRNPTFEQPHGVDQPVGYELGGSAVYRPSLLDPGKDTAVHGVALTSAARAGEGGRLPTGTVSQTVSIDTREGRSFCFRFRGLPQDGFAVASDGLYMQVEFFGDAGQTAYDRKSKPLYQLVQQARRDMGVNGDGHVGGAAVWREYALTFYVPFPQVDRLKLTVGCKGGMESASGVLPSATAKDDGRRGENSVKHINTAGDAFLVGDFTLTRLAGEAASEHGEVQTALHSTAAELLPLGGRWFYRIRPGETHAPALFDHTNADRLLYHDGSDDGYNTPFDGNMSAALHPGDEDLDGRSVTTDQAVADNVTVRFDADSMIVHTHGLPNHPTGRFPENGFGPGLNPNCIQEQDATYHIPLLPKVNPDHTTTTANNSNRALNMGPIGVAVNGVVFFNPFDAGSLDASNIMDRCCGHPNPEGQYHYHKYPVCLNSPWTDEGKTHSPLLGWAFDGFPVYGPYESANVMAKDVTGQGALNDFNLHYDAQRGWHYHVTPGRFPYLIGGYWGQVDRRNVRPLRRHGPAPGEGPLPGAPW